MSYLYREHEVAWRDGSAIPAELRDMLLTTLQPGFEIEEGTFEWDGGNSLSMTFRLSVLRARQRPRTWEVTFSCPAGQAMATWPGASRAEHEWFARMVRSHIAEWLEGSPSKIESARLVK